MSIVKTDCAKEISGSVCAHIRRYYRNQTGDPPIFFFLSEKEFPSGAKFEPSESTTGDKLCHGDIMGARNADLKRAFAPKNWSQYFVCDGDQIRLLESGDIEAFLARRKIR